MFSQLVLRTLAGFSPVPLALLPHSKLPPPPGALVWRRLSISEPQLPPNNLAGRELQQHRKRVAGGEGPAPSPGLSGREGVCSDPRWPDANEGTCRVMQAPHTSLSPARPCPHPLSCYAGSSPTSWCFGDDVLSCGVSEATGESWP